MEIKMYVINIHPAYYAKVFNLRRGLCASAYHYAMKYN